MQSSSFKQQTSIEVVGAVLIKNGQILIVQRAEHDVGGGLWEFPGGKVESGETKEQALIREIDEELSLKILVTDFLGAQDFESANRKYKLFLYLCPILSGEPVLHEHQDLRWVIPKDLSENGFSSPDIPFIKIVREKLSAGLR